MKPKTTISKLKLELESLQGQVERALDESYADGFAAGLAVTPDKQKFHKEHLEPRDYGEDGEIYVLSGRFSAKTALAKFRKMFKTEQLFDDDELADLEDRIYQTKIAPSVDEEFEYIFNRDGKNGIYDAWVWTA